MKKLIMMAVTVAASATAFAQDNVVKEAQKLCDKGEFEEALKIITPALTSDATTDKAAAWNTLNNIHYQKFADIQQKKAESEIKKDNTPYDTLGMHRSIIAAMEAALKCDEFDRQPNEKGKVKIRFRKANQDRYQMGRLSLIQAGLFEYNHKNLDNAQKAWTLYIDSAEDHMFTDIDLTKDEYRAEIAYFAGLVSYQKKDYASAVKYAKIAAQDSAKAADANEILLFSQKENCKTKEDSLAYVGILKDLHKQKPNEDKYFNLLMEYYSAPGRQAERMKWLEEEITADPKNKMAWALKGEAEMNSQKWNEAVESYKKALEIDPNFIQVIFNIGVCLNSKAIELKDQLADKKTGGLTTANLNKVKEVLNQALTYMEKAKELDPSREKVNWAYPLYQIYYSLGNKEKSAEMEKLLGN